MLTTCTLCLALVTAPAAEGPLTRAARTAFTQAHATDAERVAREVERREREHSDADRLNHAMWTYAATAGADWAVTAACINAQCQPRTHVGLFLHGVRPAAAIPIGLAIDAALAVGIRKYLAEDHPRAAEVALYVLSGARLAVTTHKIGQFK